MKLSEILLNGYNVLFEDITPENITQNSVIVYHVTNSSPSEFKGGFLDPRENHTTVNGQMYGNGIYTSYKLGNTKTWKYGTYMLKMRVKLGDVIIYDPELAKARFGDKWLISDQLASYGITDNKINLGYRRHIKEIDDKMKNLKPGELTSSFALKLAPLTRAYVDTIIFTGNNDGNVLVSYNFENAVVLSYFDFSEVDTSDLRKIQWIHTKYRSSAMPGAYRDANREMKIKISKDVDKFMSYTPALDKIILSGDVTANKKTLDVLIQNIFSSADADWYGYVGESVGHTCIFYLVDLYDEYDAAGDILKYINSKGALKPYFETYNISQLFKNHSMKVVELFNELGLVPKGSLNYLFSIVENMYGDYNPIDPNLKIAQYLVDHGFKISLDTIARINFGDRDDISNAAEKFLKKYIQEHSDDFNIESLITPQLSYRASPYSMLQVIKQFNLKPTQKFVDEVSKQLDNGDYSLINYLLANFPQFKYDYDVVFASIKNLLHHDPYGMLDDVLKHHGDDVVKNSDANYKNLLLIMALEKNSPAGDALASKLANAGAYIPINKFANGSSVNDDNYESMIPYLKAEMREGYGDDLFTPYTIAKFPKKSVAIFQFLLSHADGDLRGKALEALDIFKSIIAGPESDDYKKYPRVDMTRYKGMEKNIKYILDNVKY